MMETLYSSARKNYIERTTNKYGTLGTSTNVSFSLKSHATERPQDNWKDMWPSFICKTFEHAVLIPTKVSLFCTSYSKKVLLYGPICCGSQYKNNPFKNFNSAGQLYLNQIELNLLYRYVALGFDRTKDQA